MADRDNHVIRRVTGRIIIHKKRIIHEECSKIYCTVSLDSAMLFMPDSAWAQANKQEFVIKGCSRKDSFGPVAGASIIAKNQPGWVQLLTQGRRILQ